jgi:hypothetical protein
LNDATRVPPDGNPTDYQGRLTNARLAVKALHELLQGRELPADLRDQLNAATRDTHAFQRRFGQALRGIEPDRQWRTVTGDRGPRLDEATARLIAAISTFQFCSHLRRIPGQPTVARMPLRRVDCHRCISTHVNPPPNEDDRCDWCGKRGVVEFWPMSISIGYMQAVGDACGDCYAAMNPEGG